MIFKHVITNALKGQNHQRRATPCDWKTEPFQALKGRHQTLFTGSLFRITPLQGFDLCMCPCPFHRALPDAMLKGFQPLVQLQVVFLFLKVDDF